MQKPGIPLALPRLPEVSGGVAAENVPRYVDGGPSCLAAKTLYLTRFTCLTMHPAGSRRAGPFTRRRRVTRLGRGRRYAVIRCLAGLAKIASCGLTASDIVTRRCGSSCARSPPVPSGGNRASATFRR
ncbi:hypothetical protein KCP77_20450 [Salmonella enterica subsp. enterica]|nr:hypothetical protein KCP77_20450 [Salmonella enterica subsp. enterica]